MSIPICTEQPGTPWFAIGLSFCRPAAAVFDINANGVDGAAAPRASTPIDCPSAVCRAWWPSPPTGTSTCCSSAATPTTASGRAGRRSDPLLWDRHSELRLFRFAEPVHGGVPGLVFGADKYALLARSRVLVNIHRDDQRAWLLRVGADRRGDGQRHDRRHRAVGRASSRFVPASHFVETDDIAGTVAELLDDAGAVRGDRQRPAPPPCSTSIHSASGWLRCSTGSTAST